MKRDEIIEQPEEVAERVFTPDVQFNALNKYQKLAAKYAKYPESSKIIYPTLGITGESGEVSDKVKKVIRDGNGEFTPEIKKEIAKEIGDVLWYCAILARDLGFTLAEVAYGNILKLESRYQRNDRWVGR